MQNTRTELDTTFNKIKLFENEMDLNGNKITKDLRKKLIDLHLLSQSVDIAFTEEILRNIRRGYYIKSNFKSTYIDNNEKKIVELTKLCEAIENTVAYKKCVLHNSEVEGGDSEFCIGADRYVKSFVKTAKEVSIIMLKKTINTALKIIDKEKRYLEDEVGFLPEKKRQYDGGRNKRRTRRRKKNTKKNTKKNNHQKKHRKSRRKTKRS